MTLEALPQSPDQKCPVRGGCSRYYSVQFQVPPFITMKSGNLIQLLYFRGKKKGTFLSCCYTQVSSCCRLTKSGVLHWTEGMSKINKRHHYRLLFLPKPQTQEQTKLVLACPSVTQLLLLVTHEPQQPPFTARLPGHLPSLLFEKML